MYREATENGFWLALGKFWTDTRQESQDNLVLGMVCGGRGHLIEDNVRWCKQHEVSGEGESITMAKVTEVCKKLKGTLEWTFTLRR